MPEIVYKYEVAGSWEVLIRDEDGTTCPVKLITKTEPPNDDFLKKYIDEIKPKREELKNLETANAVIDNKSSTNLSIGDIKKINPDETDVDKLISDLENQILEIQAEIDHLRSISGRK